MCFVKGSWFRKLWRNEVLEDGTCGYATLINVCVWGGVGRWGCIIWCLHRCVYVYKARDNLSYSSGIINLRWGLSLACNVAKWTRLAGQKAPRDLPVSPFHLTIMPGFLHMLWGSNSCPHTCKVSALSTETSLQPQSSGVSQDGLSSNSALFCSDFLSFHYPKCTWGNITNCMNL